MKSKKYNNIFILIILLFSLFLFYFLLQKYYFTENFIGNKKSNDDDISLNNETKVEKKDYSNFPPLENKSKYDLLNDIFGKNQVGKVSERENKVKEVPIKMPQIQSNGIIELEKSKLQQEFSKLDDKKPLLGTCDFYFNKCPSNKNSVGSISGKELSCNKSDNNSTQAEAVAQIQSGHISKIIIVKSGSGYNSQNPPLVTIVGGKGNGATAKAQVNNDGSISNIDVIDYGYGYVETPEIKIEAPQMDGVCHLCC